MEREITHGWMDAQFIDAGNFRLNPLAQIRGNPLQLLFDALKPSVRLIGETNPAEKLNHLHIRARIR